MAIKMDKATDNYPVIKDRRDFDQKTGNRVERLIFNYRALIILAITLVSLT